MKPVIELLYFEGCPNYEFYLPRLSSLLAAAGCEAPVQLQCIDSDDSAVEARFLGSPTVRVNGNDVEPDADARQEYGLQCRIYRTEHGPAGVPPDALVLAALAASARQ